MSFGNHAFQGLNVLSCGVILRIVLNACPALPRALPSLEFFAMKTTTCRVLYHASCVGILIALAAPALSQPAPQQRRSVVRNTPDVAGGGHASREQAPHGEPSVFIENRGQWDSRVRFLLRTGGLDTWVTDQGVVYDLYRTTPAKAERKDAPGILSNTVAGIGEPAMIDRRGHVVSISFQGASPAPAAHGLDRQPGYHNYFIGNDPARWAPNVPLYGRAMIEGIYPGIDAMFYLDAGNPRYDLVVAPGADPSRVRMKIDGAKAIGVTKEGSLSIATSLGTIEQRELFAYQQTGEARKQVKCRFVIDGSRGVRFDVGSYDRTRPLVIDPLVYSTYLGGSGDDVADMIAVDGSGNAYVTGFTWPTDFPTSGAYQSSNAGGAGDVFVTKFNSAGSLAYSTYLGGSQQEVGYAIAVDGSGNAYVTGSTWSTDFPTSGPYQASNGGGGDVYIAKLNSAGNALAYSTYLGGSLEDFGTAIAVDGSGNAFVTGWTNSTNLPTSGAYQSSLGGEYDAFITKLNSGGSTIAYSTYLGGTGLDYAYAIAIDASSNPYVTGFTYSSDFPTSNAVQSSNAGGADLFITKLNSGGSTIAYSTYLGGGGEDFGFEIAVDGSGNAYLSGATTSTDFPTSGALQSSYGGNTDAFVTRLNSSGSAIAYSTYLGGSDYDAGDGIAVDGSGNVYVTGATSSTNFPTFDPYQASFAGGTYDAFITKLNSSGGTLAYSTYFGGSDDDVAYGLAIDGSGNAYITGYTFSSDYPTYAAFQSSHGGERFDGFVTKLSGGASVTVTAPNGGESWCAGSAQSITWTSSGITNIRIDLSSDGGSTFGTTIVASTPASTGSYSWSIPSGQAAGATYRIRVSDAGNASVNDLGDASFTIINSPPTLLVTLSPTTLWPPNNSMRTITVSATAGDDCGNVSWVLTSIVGDDGATSSDWSYTPNSSPSTFELRARRTSNGGGRAYTATFVATDGSGNTTTATGRVYVPHDLGNGKRAPGNPAGADERVFSSISLPNPFSASTGIHFELAAPARVTLRIYDESAREVAVVLDEELSDGAHQAIWNGLLRDGTPASSGRYYYRIESGGASESGTMLLIR
jgi:hypothetical protein